MAIEMTVKSRSKVRRRTANVRWRPATLAAFREADKLEADLAAGRTTKEQLIKEGRLFTSVKTLVADCAKLPSATAKAFASADREMSRLRKGEKGRWKGCSGRDLSKLWKDLES